VKGDNQNELSKHITKGNSFIKLTITEGSNIKCLAAHGKPKIFLVKLLTPIPFAQTGHISIGVRVLVQLILHTQLAGTQLGMLMAQ